MSNEEENLPTAARWQEITLGNGEDASDIFVQHDEVERFEDKDEFVLRKDVEDIIKDREHLAEAARHYKSNIEKNWYKDMEEKLDHEGTSQVSISGVFYGYKLALKELLDEVQSE